MLEDHADMLPLLAKLFLGKLAQILILHDHRSLSRNFDMVDASYECTLSCTGHTDDTIYVSGFDVERHMLQRVNLAVFCLKFFGYILYLDDCHRRTSFPSQVLYPTFPI